MMDQTQRFRPKTKFGTIKSAHLLRQKNNFSGCKLNIQDKLSPLSLNINFKYVAQKKQATHVALIVMGNEEDAQKQYITLHEFKTSNKIILEAPARIFSGKHQFLKLEYARTS